MLVLFINRLHATSGRGGNYATQPRHAEYYCPCLEIFHFYPAPQQFNICVPCCVSEEMAQALRQTPLRQLTVEMIYEWNSSARPFEQQNDEIRYLLPRLLELLAHGHSPAINEELCLKRIGAISPDTAVGGA